MLTLWALPVALLSLAVALVLSALTYLRPPLLAWSYEFIPLHVATLLVWGAAVAEAVRLSPGRIRGGAYRWPPVRRLVGSNPHRALAFVVGGVLVGFTGWVTGLVTAHGAQPVRTSSGAYGLDTHGSIQLVTASQYRDALGGQNRAFMGFAITMLTVAVPVLVHAWSSRRTRDEETR